MCACVSACVRASVSLRLVCVHVYVCNMHVRVPARFCTGVYIRATVTSQSGTPLPWRRSQGAASIEVMPLWTVATAAATDTERKRQKQLSSLTEGRRIRLEIQFIYAYIHSYTHTYIHTYMRAYINQSISLYYYHILYI